MDSNEIERLKKENDAKVNEAFHSSLALENYMAETLENFAYRYFTDDKYGESKTTKQGSILSIASLDSNIKQALKTKNPKIREEIVKLVQRVPVKDAHVGLFINVDVVELIDDEKGTLKITAGVNWDYPSHQDMTQQEVINVDFKFDEPIELRNHFAAKLEEACEIFA